MRAVRIDAAVPREVTLKEVLFLGYRFLGGYFKVFKITVL